MQMTLGLPRNNGVVFDGFPAENASLKIQKQKLRCGEHMFLQQSIHLNLSRSIKIYSDCA